MQAGKEEKPKKFSLTDDGKNIKLNAKLSNFWFNLKYFSQLHRKTLLNTKTTKL